MAADAGQQNSAVRQRQFGERATLALSTGAAAGLVVSAVCGWERGLTHAWPPVWTLILLTLLLGAAAGLLARPQSPGAALLVAGAAALGCWQGGAGAAPASIVFAVAIAALEGSILSVMLTTKSEGAIRHPELSGAPGGCVDLSTDATGAWIVIPTYQERENIESLLCELRRLLPGAVLLVVDDDSPDGTAEAVRDLAEGDPHVRLLLRCGQRGLGGALRAGFCEALAAGAGVVVTMDADGSHEPGQIAALLGALEVADVAIGSRYVDGGCTEGWPRWRRLVSLCANTFARRLLGLQARDCSSGFRAYRSAALRSALLIAPPEAGFALLEALLFCARSEGLSVVEVPIRFHGRRAGRSKLRVSEAWRGAHLLWSLRHRMESAAQRRSPGFTLVELLTCMAVLTILMTLLLPSLVSARRAAQRSTCLSNVRQLALALAVYEDDYDATLPRWYNGSGAVTWDGALSPYVKSRQVYHCPANPRSTRAAVVRSYALPRNVSGLALAAVPRPSDTVALFEKGGMPLGERADSTGEFFAQTYGVGDYRLWHDNGKVFGFLDGHARFWPVGQGPWAYDFRPPWGNNNYGPGYCGGQINTIADQDGGPGKNLPP